MHTKLRVKKAIYNALLGKKKKGKFFLREVDPDTAAFNKMRSRPQAAALTLIHKVPPSFLPSRLPRGCIWRDEQENMKHSN